MKNKWSQKLLRNHAGSGLLQIPNSCLPKHLEKTEKNAFKIKKSWRELLNHSLQPKKPKTCKSHKKIRMNKKWNSFSILKLGKTIIASINCTIHCYV